MSNLVLTRRKQESVIIHINDEIICKVTVTSLGNKQVKLAFEADKEVKVDREEIFNKK
jgi:carbon storage regulator CsrA|tara:strand:- start:1385 stop:1558 length:174 start_codon:yes stop_codon:yes gene_type:complete